MAFGLEIIANHLRPNRDGQLTAVATPVHRGRTTHVWDIRISDENDKLVCVSRCTVAVADRPPDNGSPFSRDLPSFRYYRLATHLHIASATYASQNPMHLI